MTLVVDNTQPTEAPPPPAPIEEAPARTSPAQDVPTKLVHESPSNPRKIFGDLTELAASVAKHGILQPVLARPSPTEEGHFELVFGHRRYRAAVLARVDTIPVMIREMSDREVLEAQVIENGQRKDIHPLEEAEAYEQLHKTHGMTVDEIVAKTSKSRASVYARMKLLDLSPEGRKAFYDGVLTPSTALYVARIPSTKLQKEAIEEIGDGRGEEPMSAREAQLFIETKYMLRLVDAPFSTKDAKLVPAAGACTTCPKRTGNQPELFADVKTKDVCTDTLCYATKVEAEWDARVTEAKERGHEVVSSKDAKKLFPYGAMLVSSDYVDLEAFHGDKTWREVLDIKKKPMPITLARDPKGGIHELVKAAEALARQPVKKEKEPKLTAAEKKADEEAESKWKKETAAREKTVKARKAALLAVVEAAEKREPGIAFWRAALVDQVVATGDESVLQRRGLSAHDSHATDEEELAAIFAKMDLVELRGFLVEFLIGGGNSEVLKAACADYGIKVPA